MNDEQVEAKLVDFIVSLYERDLKAVERRRTVAANGRISVYLVATPAIEFINVSFTVSDRSNRGDARSA